jgi:hypothetical protein
MAYSRGTRGACAILVLCVCSVSQADPPQLTPQPGILVLRNGRVLRGEIVRVGDRFSVTLGAQDEVRVSADSVEMHCASLEEAYQLKRDNLPQLSSAAEHLALADWCLRCELMASAAEQLMAAQRREPENPAAALFERRLRLAAQHTQAPAVPDRPSPPLLSQVDLEQFVRGMPNGTIEQFTNAIQPLLVNRCGATACHGANSESSFRLSYPGSSRILPRRFTQLNLHTTMQQVNRENPMESPLLVMATSAHGTCDRPTLDNRDGVQLQQLVDWLGRCTSVRIPPANLGSPDSLLLQPGTPPRNATSPPPSAVSVARPPAARKKIDPSPASPTAEPVAPTPPIPATSNGAGTEDPFDPAIFNRRYHGKSN